MSWHILKDCESLPCLQGQEEVSSEGISWDGEQFVPSSGPTILGRYCLPDSETGSCLDSRFGMMSKHSTETLGEGESMSSQEDFPARTSAQPAKALESTERGRECGSTWPGSFARFDPNSSSWKTPQCSLLEGLDVFSETWPRWGTMRNGECSESLILEGGTCEKEYGLLPTPLATDGASAGSANRTKNGKYWNLRDWYGVNMGTDPGLHARQRKAAFWEWLMGWPENWTELKPSETVNLQSWRQQHSGF